MRRHSRIIFSTAQIILTLAGIFFVTNLLAQDDESQIQSRYLFVFSTSSEMKNRVAATQAEINQLLALSMNGALHSGDSIGVWTFGKNVRIGEFQLVTWKADDAVGIAKSLNKFVKEQRYTGTNNFNALLPVLERVIQISPRLTVLIFCDGKDEISGTPYDNDINLVFKQHFADEKKSREPFVIVLRTQFGRYVGSSVNFPPGMVNLPNFPPLPKPSPPAPPQPVVTNAPPPEPAAPLVIIGTRVETNWEAYQFALTNVPENPAPPEQTNSSPSNAPLKTNLSAPENLSTNAEIKSRETNLPSDNSISKTNAVVLPENQNGTRSGALALGAGFLIGAIALAAIFFFRSRRDRGSLISRSMRK